MVNCSQNREYVTWTLTGTMKTLYFLTVPCILVSEPLVKLNKNFGLKIVNQGCGNTMPGLSDLVPFHSGQVENFNLLVLGQVQNLL